MTIKWIQTYGLCVAALTAWAPSRSLGAQGTKQNAAAEYVGATDRTMVIGDLELLAPLQTETLSDTALASLSSTLYQSGDSVFQAQISWGRTRPLRIVLVEASSGKTILYADLNQDRQFDETERFTFQSWQSPAIPPWPGFSQGVTIQVPLPKESFLTHVPISIVYRPAKDRGGSPLRLLVGNYVARGSVTIDGQRIPVAYSVDSETGGLQRGGYRAIADQVGIASEGRPAPVFHVGDRLLSIASADPTTGQIVLRERKAALADPKYDDGATEKTYRAKLGKLLPDFTFTDRSGKRLSLASYRGKILLIDVWALDCGPCTGDLPYLREAYRRFHSRGFEILGFEARGPSSAIDRFMQQHAIGWRQVDGTQLHKMLFQGWQVASYPTYILLDREGRVLTFGTVGPYNLRGVNLWKTLETVLSAENQADTGSSSASAEIPSTHPAVPIRQDTSRVSSAVQLERTNGTLEILGLHRWTLRMLEDTLKEAGCDLRGRQSLVACATVLQRSFKFPEATLVSPPPVQGTGSYSILSLVEPQDSARVRSRALGSEVKGGRADWEPFRTLMRENENVFRFLVESAFYPDFDFKKPHPIEVRAYISQRGRDSVLYHRWSKFLREHRTANGYATAVNVLQHSQNRNDRRIAMLIIMPFVQDTVTWQTLFNALLERDSGIRLDAAKSLGVLAQAGHRPPTWSSIAPAVHAILNGTNPGELHTIVAVLRTLKVGPEQGRLFLNGGGYMLLAYAGAKHPSFHQPALHLLRLLSGEDYGADLSRWAGWVTSLSSPPT